MTKGTSIGVDGVPRKVVNKQRGVDGEARSILRAYIGVEGQAKLIYDADSTISDDVAVITVVSTDKTTPSDYGDPEARANVTIEGITVESGNNNVRRIEVPVGSTLRCHAFCTWHMWDGSNGYNEFGGDIQVNGSVVAANQSVSGAYYDYKVAGDAVIILDAGSDEAHVLISDNGWGYSGYKEVLDSYLLDITISSKMCSDGDTNASVYISDPTGGQDSVYTARDITYVTVSVLPETPIKFEASTSSEDCKARIKLNNAEVSYTEGENAYYDILAYCNMEVDLTADSNESCVEIYEEGFQRVCTVVLTVGQQQSNCTGYGASWLTLDDYACGNTSNSHPLEEGINYVDNGTVLELVAHSAGSCEGTEEGEHFASTSTPSGDGATGEFVYCPVTGDMKVTVEFGPHQCYVTASSLNMFNVTINENQYVCCTGFDAYYMPLNVAGRGDISRDAANGATQISGNVSVPEGTILALVPHASGTCDAEHIHAVRSDGIYLNKQHYNQSGTPVYVTVTQNMVVEVTHTAHCVDVWVERA